MNAHSSINDTVISSKSNSKNSKIIDSEKTLLGVKLPDNNDLLVNTTYNQILNLTHEQLATFEYIFIDECHAMTNDFSFRPETIADLIFHLIEFVVKCPDAKTNILFMSGTPNVETLLIPKIMREYGIENLFQMVIVKKEYAVSPTINLVHLDTIDKNKRTNAVMNQIKKYKSEGRKSLCIFNYKEKMDDLHREIQTKLGKNIKVGLFYSGSTGVCTQNILSSKFGDFDVVLTTNYFVNGININKDGLTEEDIIAGKTSTQKYGVVIDLGSKYSHISAIDTIQATNRFRNRLCETTVFFPKIFKPDENRPSRKFHYGHTSKTLLGINRYNFHLLSQNENTTPNQFLDEEVSTKKIYGLDEFRKNPLSISLNEINAKSKKEENKVKVGNMINKEARIYEDWFYSLDGYHYLAKDAGFNSIIKHVDLAEPLKEMSEDQVELENKIIKTLVEDEKNIYSLMGTLENDTRIYIQASNKVVEPSCTDVGNFSIVKTQDNVCTIEGDFHGSHERTINKLFRCYFKLNFYYDRDKALEIIQNLINPEIDFLPSKDKRYLENIASYVRACNIIAKGKNLKALNYIQALDYCAGNKLGVFKVEKPTWISYTITNTKIVEIFKNNWVKQQFELIEYKLNASVQKNDWSALNSGKKVDLKKNYFGNPSEKDKRSYIHESEKNNYQKWFSDKETIKTHDLEDLENQLKQMSNYTSLSFTNVGKLKSLETIVVPKIIQSQKLFLPLEIDKDEYSEPEQVSIKYVDHELDILVKVLSAKLDKYIPDIIRKNNPYLDGYYIQGMDRLKQKDIFSFIEKTNDLINDPRSKFRPGLLPVLKKIPHDFSKIDQIFLMAFKTSEYETFYNLTKSQTSPFKKNIFFCEEDFKFKSLLQTPIPGIVNIPKKDIYNSLIKNSKQYINTKNIRKRPVTDKALVVLNNKNELLFANFSIKQACIFLCEYALKNEGFRLKNGFTPVKNDSKCIYNPDTFRKNYYPKKSVDNYSIEEYIVDLKDYVDYYKSL